MTGQWFGRRDPDRRGYFGAFGGRFVPETLVAPIEQLEREYFTAREDPAFAVELERLFRDYVGRATPLWDARRLTAAWAGLLAFLALANAALALCAVPGGVLYSFGHEPPVAVSHAAWSWFANLLNYGLVGGFMLAEFQYRKRLFPQRPYRNGVDFARQMAALGPAFWRGLLR